MTDDITLSMPAAAAALGVSRRHLERLLQRGEGPPVVRLGRRRVIRRMALRDWLLARETAT